VLVARAAQVAWDVSLQLSSLRACKQANPGFRRITETKSTAQWLLEFSECD
jgi:hypothetical protein